MAHYLIMTEKPSAAKNFSQALGGMKGTFEGNHYNITALRGHVMTLREPEDMVVEELKNRYKSWQLKNLPWQLSDLNWTRTYIKTRHPRTGRLESTKKLLDALKQESRSGHYDALIIATDTDPSGEGELLAWEAIQAIDWHGQVLRADFLDESRSGIQKAMRLLRDVSDYHTDGEYQKGESRNRWDFASMQLTRIATTVAKQAGYKVVAREGRLKSVIVRKIYEQLEAIQNYVRKPYYEVKFKDESGHTFSRSKLKDVIMPDWRYDQYETADVERKQYHISKVVNERHSRQLQAPSRLIDLAGLAAILAPRGFDSKDVLSTYQKMYEAQIVSYPRTEDRTITLDQFNELLPLIDQIADVVNVDKTLLTHRKARSTHVRDSGTHGANRPGTHVPESLVQLDRFGKSAQIIYQIVAKNYLAMLAEDYVYDHITANLEDYPSFKTAYNEPIALNFKLIYDISSDLSDMPVSKILGDSASPFVFEGANQKPTQPSTKWIMAYLESHHIGTGATRVSTLSDMSRGTRAMLKETKGKLTLTETGNVSAILNERTWIASPKITKRLFEMMTAVGKFEMMPETLLNSITMVVAHDMPIMIENAERLRPILGDPKPKWATSKKKVSEKISGTWHGEVITISREWGDHRFSEVELTELFAGHDISFSAKTKRGKSYTAIGKLAQSTYKKTKYIGFKLNPKVK